MLDDYPDVLTVAQVCAVLDIGRNSAYLLLQSQGLKSVRVGRKYLIPKRYVLDFLGLSDYTVHTPNNSC